jgi:amino acid transporter
MGVFSNLKHALIGRPIHSKLAHHERLIVFLALPVFASDALSSTAYASEEVLLKLVGAGPGALHLLVPLSLALVALLWVVVVSYRTTIFAYPEGGGAYSVASDNLGRWPGLVAAASLLIGYLLTVTVSVSAGASAVVALFPQTQAYASVMASAAVLLITFVNLRGVKESGTVFAVPTYGFVLLVLLVVGWALKTALLDGVPPQPPIRALELDPHLQDLSGWRYLLFLFGAFAAGCTALTGTEAIANGVMAFKAPEPLNASRTLIVMGVILSLTFFGVSWAAYHFGIVPMHFTDPGYKTVLAQIAGEVFGTKNALYFCTQASTALILILAANTAYSDFPRLSRLVARDGFLPRQLTSLGDRLVFQNGIITLAVLSVILIMATHADTHQMIPMYAISVFTTFTLSQAGMIFWWNRHNKRSLNKWVNVVGTLVCGSVAFVLLVTRFKEGAWLTLVSVAILLYVFSRIRRHYDWLANKLNLTPKDHVVSTSTTVLLLVPRLHKGILKAISYAKALSKDVRAIHVVLDPANASSVKAQWATFGEDMPLVILESPYRSLVRPVLEYIDQTVAEAHDPNHIVTVIVPEAVAKNWVQGLLHSNLALFLKIALGGRRNVVISNVRYFLD